MILGKCVCLTTVLIRVEYGPETVSPMLPLRNAHFETRDLNVYLPYPIPHKKRAQDAKPFMLGSLNILAQHYTKKPIPPRVHF